MSCRAKLYAVLPTIALASASKTAMKRLIAIPIASAVVAAPLVQARTPPADRAVVHLAVEQRYERRDLAVTTDFRDLFAEIVTRHLGLAEAGPIFPGFAVEPARFPGVMAV